MLRMLHQVWKRQSPLVEHTFFLTSSHEPEPNVWTTATNCAHDALAETPTAETATTSSGADENDENDDDQDDEYEYVNTKTDKNIKFKKR